MAFGKGLLKMTNFPPSFLKDLVLVALLTLGAMALSRFYMDNYVLGHKNNTIYTSSQP
jgi:hypothetical protein